ncbi:MAG: serine/threonine protein kinase, partial [Actinomycetales bacterium]
MIEDRYELVSKIGRGGTGDVWLGHDHLLGRDVALKQLGLTPGAELPDTARAEREARLSASVRHPSVVAVYDVADDEDGREWLVMELVEGRSLAELIKESGPIPQHRLTPLVRDIVDGLAAAHTAGIVHRDVKPSNVLLTPEGLPKLTDFGVARTITDTALTSTGIVTGSPGYLAPEVAEGSSATHASDVWSLGATVFHAATGER